MTAPDFNALYAEHLAILCRRADEALIRSACDHLLIPSGSPHYHVFDDRDYPYAVNPHFKHWLPLTQVPDSWLLYTPGRRPQVIYLQPFDYWHAVPQAPQGWWVNHVDIHIIRKPEEALPLLPRNVARCAILGEAHGIPENYRPNNPIPALEYLHYHRAYKTSYELVLMREAQHIAARGHHAAERAFRGGGSEFDIHMAYCTATGQDAVEAPYRNIVALNAHGAILHYTRLDRDASSQAHSFLIDAGADRYGYASDITRTYAADIDNEFQAMIDAVDTVQIALGQAVRNGLDYRQLHLDAHLALAGVLKDFGILEASPGAALETGVSSVFFPHGIGHLLGLQVHDVAGFAANDQGGTIPRPDGHPFLRMTRTLEPGMVVTIEPGLYFIDLLLNELRQGPYADSVNWSRIEAFRAYGGIRIEDNIVCTTGASENLTRSAFAAFGS
ncbi:MAG: Xaa-Pro dipeptidase [Xanthomonadaceae bacterium]|jgi:Xaa-Pro dipeptidase|nr:Xaa-Pro dipeptidase [Xanthomonadaceae bacterium]